MNKKQYSIIFGMVLVITFTSVLEIKAEPAPHDPVAEAIYEANLLLRYTQTAKEQIENDIIFMDVTCNNNKISMLKYSANSVVCIYPESKSKLEQRIWGITHKTDDVGVRVWECTDRYVMTVSNDKPTKGEIIKKFRMTVKDIAKDQVFWKPIKIEPDHRDTSKIGIDTNGKFTEENIELIISQLSKIDKVKSVHRDMRGCL